jgi:hypothetical protein
MVDRALDGLMALFWIGIILALLATVVAPLGLLAGMVVWVAGHLVAWLSLLGVAYLVVTEVPRLLRRRPAARH